MKLIIGYGLNIQFRLINRLDLPRNLNSFKIIDLASTLTINFI